MFTFNYSILKEIEELSLGSCTVCSVQCPDLARDVLSLRTRCRQPRQLRQRHSGGGGDRHRPVTGPSPGRHRLTSCHVSPRGRPGPALPVTAAHGRRRAATVRRPAHAAGSHTCSLTPGRHGVRVTQLHGDTLTSGAGEPHNCRVTGERREGGAKGAAMAATSGIRCKGCRMALQVIYILGKTDSSSCRLLWPYKIDSSAGAVPV